MTSRDATEAAARLRAPMLRAIVARTYQRRPGVRKRQPPQGAAVLSDSTESVGDLEIRNNCLTIAEISTMVIRSPQSLRVRAFAVLKPRRCWAYLREEAPAEFVEGSPSATRCNGRRTGASEGKSAVRLSNRSFPGRKKQPGSHFTRAVASAFCAKRPFCRQKALLFAHKCERFLRAQPEPFALEFTRESPRSISSPLGCHRPLAGATKGRPIF
jgi:hypothetical protein